MPDALARRLVPMTGKKMRSLFSHKSLQLLLLLLLLLLLVMHLL